MILQCEKNHGINRETAIPFLNYKQTKKPILTKQGPGWEVLKKLFSELKHI